MQSSGRLVLCARPARRAFFSFVGARCVEQVADSSADSQLELDAGIIGGRSLVSLVLVLDRELCGVRQDLFPQVRIRRDLGKERLTVENDLAERRKTATRCAKPEVAGRRSAPARHGSRHRAKREVLPARMTVA